MSILKTFLSVMQVVFIALLSIVSVLGAAGDVDPSFNAAGAYINSSSMSDFAIQPDGKIIIGGAFAIANETARQGVVRLNADGTLDTTFRAPDFRDAVSRVYGATINSIELQADGKVLVGGRFDVIGSTYKHIIRLNADGSLDTTFTNHSEQFDATEYINEIELQANGAILISGELSMSTLTSNTQMVARLNASDGALDTTLRFANPGTAPRELAVQPDGKILISDQNLGRFNTDGSVDNTFPIVVSGGTIEKILVKPDGKIVIGGTFTTVNGFQQHRVSQVNSDGSFDTNFNSNNLGADGIVHDIALDANGKILIAGNFTNYNGTPRSRIARLNADGSLDLSFTAPASSIEIKSVISLSNGQIFIGSPGSINRLNTDGTLDLTLSQPRLGTIGNVSNVIQQPDGKLIISGYFDTANGVPRNAVARLNLDGTLDTSFVPFLNGPFTIQGLAIQSTGKILIGVAGGVYRLNTNGTRDFSFSQVLGTGIGTADIYVYPDDKILVSGYYKLLPDGARDTSFNPPGTNGQIFAAVVQPDGKIVFGGDFTLIGGKWQRGNIGRWNTDGTLDTTFNTLIGANAPVHGIELQPDGKVIVVGRFTFMNNNPTKKYIARLNTDGSVDQSFSSVLGIYHNPPFLVGLFAVKIQPDGKVLIGGTLFSVNGVARNNYARLNSNGSLDPTFNAIPGADGHVLKIKLQSDNKILLTGFFTKVNDVSKIGIARLLNPPTVARTNFDYDGDGRADVSVFRPSTNRWYIFKSSDATVTETTFGIANDVVAPADYDGDGKTDIGIFRPSSGDWWYQSSINNTQNFVDWGASGDIPRPSDFDGDGKADFVVFRPSNSTWYRISSTGATSNIVFGLSGDKPVTGDFDGDGKSDVAIYRPSTGDWWWQSSLDNVQRATHWGINTDLPAPADYDGDGKTDFAVYRPSNGTWYVYNSATLTSTIFNFGIAEDKPVPADYDGDGKADIAVFRPSTGTWYQQKTTAGFAAQQFGVATDVPTENAFVP